MSLAYNIIAFPVQPVPAPVRRPAALVRAATAGQAGWRRSRDLPRLMRGAPLPPPGAALPWLRAEEDRLNADRQAGAADYDMHRHVMLMIALVAESRIVAPAGPRLRVVGG